MTTWPQNEDGEATAATAALERELGDDEAPAPQEFPGMTFPLSVACANWLRTKSRIIALQDALEDNARAILNELREQGKPEVKFQDPDTNEWHLFAIKRGRDTIAVRKAKKD